jgi:hypothetical protein
MRRPLVRATTAGHLGGRDGLVDEDDAGRTPGLKL